MRPSSPLLLSLFPLLFLVLGCKGPEQEGPTHLASHLDKAGSEGWQPLSLEAVLEQLKHRGEWQDHARPLPAPRHPAEKYLKGWIIVLDPGHGGRADAAGYKRGPTGVREAEMNLRVAKLLRRLLVDAGAKVTLTREGECSEAADDRLKDTLFRRAQIANEHPRPDGGKGADLFISLHHNAFSRPEPNYPSIWFHGSPDQSEVGLDAAKYVGHRIGAELRCSQVGKTSVLMNDTQMYMAGFGVLRHAKVPAFLIEASFFTEPVEEQRLRDAAYNLREAYAIYLGLVEYAYGGRPTQSPPKLSRDGKDLVLRTTLDEGLPDWWGHDKPRILRSSTAVFVDNQRVPVRFDPKSKVLEARFPAPEKAKQLEISVHHANLYKHHNWPQRYTLPFKPDNNTGAK
ncbi:MAG: hypothetical protein CSA62_07615 [Planctomycetota bacterium]|nr:MAG: hypothetical protein CSA62_07615 [Planctomycetota bacterium]